MTFYHQPVLLKEVLTYLKAATAQRVIDATVGEAGHSLAMIKIMGSSGRLLALDWDAVSLNQACKKLAAYKEQVTFVQGNFAELPDIALRYGFHQVDAILFDLGLSSFQLEASGRGFAFKKNDEPLDMRYAAWPLTAIEQERKNRKLAKMSPDQNLSTLRRRFGPKLEARDILNKLSVEELVWLLRQYGEETRASAIATAVVSSRKKKPVQYTQDLRDLPVFQEAAASKRHPATRTFMALRIAVNNETENIKAGLQGALELLAPGGRLGVITFHSLEDHQVKEIMVREARDCLCAPAAPECRCSHQARWRIITPKPVKPGSAEIAANPASRSAQLRVVEKLKYKK